MGTSVEPHRVALSLYNRRFVTRNLAQPEAASTGSKLDVA